MSDALLIRTAVIEAAKHMLASWDTQDVPIKWPNSLDWQAGGGRCRENGSPWVEVKAVQVTVRPSFKSGRQIGKGLIAFLIKSQLGAGEQAGSLIAEEISSMLTGKNKESVFFISSMIKGGYEDAENYITEFVVNWEKNR